jgi:hypothetical protein
MSNDTSVFPAALLENAVARPIAGRGDFGTDAPGRVGEEHDLICKR